MHGDADEYTSKKYGPFPTQQILDDFLDCILSASRRKAPTKNTYWDVWKGEGVPTEKVFLNQDFVNNIDYHSEYDCFDNNTLASLNYVFVDYIDQNGIVYRVKWEE